MPAASRLAESTVQTDSWKPRLAEKVSLGVQSACRQVLPVRCRTWVATMAGSIPAKLP